MQALLKCLAAEKGVHSECKHLSRVYMECRASNGLMTVITSESLDAHGMSPDEIARAKGQATPYNRDKTAKGFLAGSGEVEAVREHRATQAKQK